MPTPFTHLAAAERLLNDPALENEHRERLSRSWGAFLLGSIAPDAHHQDPAVHRADTHFFHYQATIEPPPEQVMLQHYPELAQTDDPQQAAFIAGYLSHLAMDIRWTEDVFIPHFWRRDHNRHLAFVALLSIRDQQAYERLPSQQAAQLRDIKPANWLPFLSDEALIMWRDIIAGQLNGEPLTLQVLGRVVHVGYAGLVSLLDAPDRLQKQLWDYYTPAQLAEYEALEYQHMRRVVCTYLQRN